MSNILPTTPPPPTPEHNKIDENDSNFIQQCRDFMDYLAHEGYILIKPKNDNCRISGNYDFLRLNSNDEPLQLIFEYLELDFQTWKAEKEALNIWASQNQKKLD
jgi:hypothetical protein